MREQLLTQYASDTLPGPLNNTLVLGFCYYVSGPIALQNLVTQGALVIKVERKPLGDPSRYVFSRAMFNSLAHGQLSLAVDYKQEADRHLLETLLDASDIIVDNRSNRAKKNDRILQNYLQGPKPRPKIYCSIDGFPNAEVNTMPGLDASAQASTGLAYTNCASPERPMKVGVPILDIATGLLATNYILANLVLLKQSSLPTSTNNLISISVSLAGTSVWLQTGQMISALEGEEFFRTGNQDRFAVPFSYYTAKNGLISIATVNETQFKTLCIEILKDEVFHQKYSTTQVRIKHQDQFERELNEKLKTRNREYWFAQCKQHGIPASPVLTVSEAVQQKYVRALISSSTDDTPVVTHGATHSLFAQSTKPRPAPALDQDHDSLSELCENSNRGGLTLARL